MTERRRHLAAVATIAWMTAVINGVYYIYKSISPGEALADMGAVALIAVTAGGLGLRLLGAQNPPGRTGEIVLAARLLPGMILSWRRAIRPEGKKEFYWALGATLIVSNLIVPRSATTNYDLMLIPILWVLADLDRGGRWGRLGLLAITLVSRVGLWWPHISTVDGNQGQAIMFLPPPILLGTALVFGRRWLVQDAELAMVQP